MKLIDDPEALIISFWQFSCDFYGIKAVSQELHILQDLHHLNVNRVLYALFLSKQGVSIDSATDNFNGMTAINALELWIQKIRLLRNALKVYPVKSIRLNRPKVLSLELKLEKYHQRLLVLSSQAHLILRYENCDHKKIQTLFKTNLACLHRSASVPLKSLQGLISHLPSSS